MNVPFFANVITLGCMLVASALSARALRDGRQRRAKWALVGVSLVYALVALSNVLEHGGITDVLDPVEDMLEIVFLLGFFFGVHAWQAERALERERTQRAWLSATFSAIGAGVLTTDASGVVQTVNPEMTRLLGREETALVGAHVEDVLTLVVSGARAPLANPVTRALETARGVDVPEGAYLRVGSSDVPLSGSVSPMSSADDEVRGAVAVLRDETERGRLKEQLLHAQKMEALGRLAGGVAHDFNNMLGGILGAADLLAETIETPKAKRLVQIVVEAAENAADLTTKLLAFGRKSHMDVTRVALHELVQSTVSIAERAMEKRVRIELDMPSGPLVVLGDSSQLKSAVLNILLNAHDAIDGSGTIYVSMEQEVLDEAWCEASPFAIERGTYARLSIRDTGGGMSPALTQRIFEPFFTTKPEGKGTGLGLAAVFGAIEAHRGAIDVYSELGRGTVFNVYLPLADGAAVLEQAPAPDPAGLSVGKVLVVDDEAVMRATVELMLTKAGFTLFMAESGQQAMALFAERAAELDAVLLDVVMPDASGFVVADAIRKIRPEIPIVFASGFVRDDLRGERAELFIDKPFRRARLLEVLSAAIARSGSPPRDIAS